MSTGRCQCYWRKVSVAVVVAAHYSCYQKTRSMIRIVFWWVIGSTEDGRLHSDIYNHLGVILYAARLGFWPIGPTPAFISWPCFHSGTVSHHFICTLQSTGEHIVGEVERERRRKEARSLA